jgi:hypothetical protein
MFEIIMIPQGLRLIVLLTVLLLSGSPTALAAGPGETPISPRAQPAAVMFAESWSIGKFFSGANSRTRVVQICVVVMCIALFIMMRK